MAFSDDNIRREDIPRDAFDLLHDLCYHHEGRDVHDYVRRAQEILSKGGYGARGGVGAYMGEVEVKCRFCGYSPRIYGPKTALRCGSTLDSVLSKLGWRWIPPERGKESLRSTLACPKCGRGQVIRSVLQVSHGKKSKRRVAVR